MLCFSVTKITHTCWQPTQKRKTRCLFCHFIHKFVEKQGFIYLFFAQQPHGNAYFVCFFFLFFFNFSSLHIEFINVLVTVKFFHQKYILLLVRTELGRHRVLSQSAIFVSLKAVLIYPKNIENQSYFMMNKNALCSWWTLMCIWSLNKP